MLRTVQNDPEKMGKVRVDATETAKKHNVVFAMNTDYYTYRVAVNNNRHTGIVIRDGRILYDDPYTEKQVTNSMFPNLDMLAFMPDGSLKVYRSWEKTAQEFIDEGVQTVYSFGRICCWTAKCPSAPTPTTRTRIRAAPSAWSNPVTTSPSCAKGA